MSTPSPSAAQAIRILLIEDHAIVRAGLRMLINSQPGMCVVGEAADRNDALLSAASMQPDIVLLDLDLGGQLSLDLIPGLLASARGARIILLTGVRDSAVHRQAVRLGAMGLVLKEKAVEVLFQAIEKVQAGEVWLERSLLAEVLGDLTRAREPQPEDRARAKQATLTEREREVIALIGEGLKNQQIAERLYISETTVRHHLTSIFNKLGLSDRLELLLYAYRHGLARPHP